MKSLYFLTVVLFGANVSYAQNVTQDHFGASNRFRAEKEEVVYPETTVRTGSDSEVHHLNNGRTVQCFTQTIGDTTTRQCY